MFFDIREVDLGIDAVITDVFDSTAMAKILAKKYPWVVPGSEDIFYLKR
jgi:hypothetical protein